MTPPPNYDDTFLRALRREPTDYTPVWLMRQAGRYLPEYCATRARAGSFMGLATDPDLATEVTLQPLLRYELDAAILFSDILTVPDAMGLGLSFVEGEGPCFARAVRTEADVQALAAPDLERLRYVFDAVARIRTALAGLARPVPLIGFSGSPWTLACYMIEGRSSTDYRNIKTMLYARPDLLERILAVNAQAVGDYLLAQIESGAQAVMIFDTWGGVLADGLFQRFSLAYTQRVLAHLRARQTSAAVPVIVYTKGGGVWLEDIADCGADAVGLDWTMDLADARRRVGHRVSLQGNMDPMALFAPEAAIRGEVRRVLSAFAAGGASGSERLQGHVFNLGHGINQFTPPDAVAALVDEVHRSSRCLHQGDGERR